jgi:GT2 family glycosyltransferase
MKTPLSKISDPGETKLKSILKFASFLFSAPGFGVLKRTVAKFLQGRGIIKQHKPDYNDWIKAKLDAAILKKDFDTVYPTFKIKPVIKIVVPVPDPHTEHAQATMDSISAQYYLHCYEVLMADAPLEKDILKDHRVNKDGTYSVDYIFFTKQDCLLTPNCLFEFVKHINVYPEHDLIYADDDVVDEHGSFRDPHFKPAWSPDNLLSRNYIGNTFLVRKTVLMGLKGLPRDYEYNNVYDLILRITEVTNKIGHIPKVLVHNRPTQTSPVKHAAAKRAIKDALVRRSLAAEVYDFPGLSEVFQVSYEVRFFGKVSIIIPSKDNTELLRTALSSIIQNTKYPDYEIIVLDNNSTSIEFAELMKEYTSKHAAKFRCIGARFPFNFAKLMNLGAAQAKGSYILMCNNDIEVTHADWMTQTVSYAQQEKTGAVGVKLLYTDGTIQHAGIVSTANGDTGHVFVNMDKDAPGYMNNLRSVTNYSAVTAACLMCRKKVYTEAGGMDESLAVEYNDVDLCLKFGALGYSNVYLPSVELFHHESATRGHPFRSKESWQQHEKELAIFRSKWPDFLECDPFYSRYLALDGSFRAIGT